jgi:hypothetical protein
MYVTKVASRQRRLSWASFLADSRFADWRWWAASLARRSKPTLFQHSSIPQPSHLRGAEASRLWKASRMYLLQRRHSGRLEETYKIVLQASGKSHPHQLQPFRTPGVVAQTDRATHSPVHNYFCLFCFTAFLGEGWQARNTSSDLRCQNGSLARI